MLNKWCDLCDEPIEDGEPVIAAVVALFKAIPSSNAYAIDMPTRCLEIVHYACGSEAYTEEQLDDENPESN